MSLKGPSLSYGRNLPGLGHNAVQYKSLAGEAGMVGEIPEGLATKVNINAERTLALSPSKGGTGPLRWQVVSRAPSPLNVQNHHLITNHMVEALEARGLDGAALRARPDLQYLSIPGGHVGYEQWHRAYDAYMDDFIRNTLGLDEETLLREVHNYYQRGEAARRIPNVNLGF